jgi:hypothetical protein
MDWTFQATDVKSGRKQTIDQRWPRTEPAPDPLHNDGSDWKAPFDSPLDCDERLYRCPDGSLVLVWKVDESNSHYHCDYVYRCEPMSESEAREWCERQGFGPPELRAVQHGPARTLNPRSYRSLWDFGRDVERALERVLSAACNLCRDDLCLEWDADAPATGPAVAELYAAVRLISDVDDWINTPDGADELVNTLFAIHREAKSLTIKVGHSLKALTLNDDFKKLSTLQGFLTRNIAGLASIPELECELLGEALPKLKEQRHRASEDNSRAPSDFVELPNGDVGFVEFASYAVPEPASDETELPATDAAGREAATVQAGAVDSASSRNVVVKTKPEIDAAQQVAGDGPVPPESFVLGNRHVKLTKKGFRLVDYLWHHDRHVATARKVCIEVWGDEAAESSALKTLVSRVNKSFLEGDMPITISIRNGYVQLTIDR